MTIIPSPDSQYSIAMDPQDPTSFNQRSEALQTGRTYHFVDQLPENYDPRRNQTLLCVHGFPDHWYGWRHQIGPWVRRGWRVVVPDMLGYGGTDKPVDASEYSSKKLCADLAALLDILGISQAVLVSHDWGAFIGGRFALWHPDRLLGLVIMSVPFTPPAPVYRPVEEFIKLAPNLGYQADFSKQTTTSLVEANLERFLRITYQLPGQGHHFTKQGAIFDLLGASEFTHPASVLNHKEFQHYLKEMKKGMNGPLNYYRTGKYRFEEEHAAQLGSHLPSDLPVLFIYGSEDDTTTKHLIQNSKKFVNDLQTVVLQNTGHWVLAERKNEVTETVADWITEKLQNSERKPKL